MPINALFFGSALGFSASSPLNAPKAPTVARAAVHHRRPGRAQALVDRAVVQLVAKARASIPDDKDGVLLALIHAHQFRPRYQFLFVIAMLFSTSFLVDEHISLAGPNKSSGGDGACFRGRNE
ncbi:MAG: hypothetical protein ABI939_10250 [Anaerolineaceae bacterium]